LGSGAVEWLGAEVGLVVGVWSRSQPTSAKAVRSAAKAARIVTLLAPAVCNKRMPVLHYVVSPILGAWRNVRDNGPAA
jgi:hypothetical protein